MEWGDRVFGGKVQRAGALQNADALTQRTRTARSVVACGGPPPLWPDDTMTFSRPKGGITPNSMIAAHCFLGRFIRSLNFSGIFEIMNCARNDILIQPCTILNRHAAFR